MRARDTYRFGNFELDVKAFELRRGKQRIHLERRPLNLLILLLSRPGELVTREEIVEHIWGQDVFTDSAAGVNTLVRKVRLALEDPSDAPRFIETAQGRGYRFVAESLVGDRDNAQRDVVADPGPALGAAVVPSESVQRKAWTVLPLAAVAVLMAATIVAAVAWWRSAPTRVSIAVLPFENIGVPAGQEHLADALHEETIIALGQVDPEHVQIVSRTATLKYGNSKQPPAEIGRELGVDYLVQSAIRVENTRIRIASSLIRVHDQVVVQPWSDDYEPRGLLEFQRELSAAIAEQISLKLSPARLAALTRRHSGDAEAVDLYFRGQFYWNQLTPATTQRAIASFEAATRRDANYALPWAGIAVAYAAAPINADAMPLAVAPKARDAAERTSRADATLAVSCHSPGAVDCGR